MATVPLSRSVMVTLDSSGNGTAYIGPQTVREVWHPTNASVSVNTNTNESVCVIFVGDAPDPRCRRASTFSGSSGDTATGLIDSLKTPQRVWAVWTGGDPRAQATLAVTGTMDV